MAFYANTSSHAPIPHILSPAIFLADAHYIPSSPPLSTSSITSSPSHALNSIDASPYMRYMKDDGLLGFLSLLLHSPTALLNPPPKQLFLMGDIAHCFFPHIPSSYNAHKDFIAILNDLSQHIEIIYFEGNHDIAIPQALFPHIAIYPRHSQPAIFCYQQRYFALSHGDIFISPLYEGYIRALSAPFTQHLLRHIDIYTKGNIYKIIAQRIAKKRIYPLIMDDEEFNNFANKRAYIYTQHIKRYYPRIAPYQRILTSTTHQSITPQSMDNIAPTNHIGVIEGHFHIGRHVGDFFALPSFCHEGKILIL